MSTQNKQLVSNFIEEIWNQNQTANIGNYLHPDFIDYSLPKTLAANIDGLRLWISETSQAFEHTTIIEEMLCEGNKVMLKIKMLMKHIGKWRDIEPIGAEIYAVGYRYFKLENNRILEHWALIDGNAIENQLKNAAHGCKIQE